MAINGEAKVRAAIDVANFSFLVTTKMKDSEMAISVNEDKMSAVSTILKEFELDRDYYQTNGLRLKPWRENVLSGKGAKQQWKTVEKGWVASNGYAITLKDISILPKLWGCIASLGCDMGETTFIASGAAKLTDECRKLAMKDALDKAKLYATVANLDIVGLQSFSERVGRTQNIKFLPNQWCKADQPGLYVTYTYARMRKALSLADSPFPDMPPIEDQDMWLAGYCAYAVYYLEWSMRSFDPCSLSNYAHFLAQKLSRAYHQERIVRGRPSFVRVCELATRTLYIVMNMLTMYPLTVV
jgi:uncharacterized protein YggE